MIGVYVIIGLWGIYFVCLLGLKIWGKFRVNSSQQEEIENIDPGKNMTIGESSSRPSYKKFNLTITIPENFEEKEEENWKFVKKYYKVSIKQTQCFPLMIFFMENKGISKIGRITLWFTVACCEVFADIWILEYYSVVTSAVLACLFGLPLSFVMVLVFSCSSVKNKKINCLCFFPYTVTILLNSAIVVLLICFKQDSNTKNFLTSCGIIGVIEFFLLEPLKTLIKAASFSVSQERKCLVSLCEKL